MNKRGDIRRGGLAGKMAGFTPEPPGSVWEGVSSQLGGGNSRRRLFNILAAAAGFALAVTVGINFLNRDLQQEFATQMNGEQPGRPSGPSADRLANEEEGNVVDGPGVSKEFSGDNEVTGVEKTIRPAGRLEGRGQATRLEEQVKMAVREVMEEKGVPGEYVVIAEAGPEVPADKSRVADSMKELGVVAGSENSFEDSFKNGSEERNRDRSEESTETRTGESNETRTGDRSEDSSEERNGVRNGEGAGERSVESAENKTVTSAGDRTGTEAARQQTDRMAVRTDSLKKLSEPELFNEPESQDQRSDGRWQLGASLSPLYNYRDVSSQTDYQKMLANNSETAMLTYAGGVQVSYTASDRVTVESGLFYTRMGVNIGDYSSFKNGWYGDRIESSAGGVYENVVSISNSIGTVVSDHNDLFLSNSGSTETSTDYHMLLPDQMMVDNAVVENFSQSLEYLELPVNMKLLVVDRSVKIRLIGGVSTNLMVNNSISANSINGSVEIGNLQNLRSLSYSGNAGIGFAYDLYENFSLSIEPKFRYYLHSVNTDLLPSTRPYTFGLYTGVNYTF
jgi:hypothetical protein